MTDEHPVAAHDGTPSHIIGSLVQFARRRPWSSLILLIGVLVLVQLFVLPYGDVARLASANPSTTAFMEYQSADAKERGKPFRKKQTWVSLNRIPKSLVDAVIVSEDGMFWSHAGFDWFEFRESLVRNFKEGRAARGASTISQQLVKNLYLSPSKNPVRKLKEWILTWWLEQRLSKSRILEVYLNVIEWGDGVYGIQAASQFYFGKSAGELTVDECARLAAIIPSPKHWSPISGSRVADRRSKLIVQRMQIRGMLPMPSEGARIDSADAFAPLPEETDVPSERGDSIRTGRDSTQQQARPSPPDSTHQNDSTVTRDL